jgi:hypothetical protein
LRRDILKLLLEIHPESSYPADIARKIDATPSNVIGALRGASWGEKRYDHSFSLTSLGLVEVVKINGQKFYRVSEKGMEVAKFFDL